MKTIQSFGKRLERGTLRRRLCDLNPAMADAWIDTFRDVEAVEILHGNLLDVSTDALVSPANSFGDMSGGIDKQIDDFYGGRAQSAVMAAIRRQFLGELPVGAALIVEASDVHYPLIVAAPTMRIPGNASATLNAYLAMRAALVAVLRHNETAPRPIESLAVPGLCTGVGGMSAGLAALQMRAAYDNIIGGGWKDAVHPALAPFALGAGSGRRWSWS